MGTSPLCSSLLFLFLFLCSLYQSSAIEIEANQTVALLVNSSEASSKKIPETLFGIFFEVISQQWWNFLIMCCVIAFRFGASCNLNSWYASFYSSNKLMRFYNILRRLIMLVREDYGQSLWATGVCWNFLQSFLGKEISDFFNLFLIVFGNDMITTESIHQD